MDGLEDVKQELETKRQELLAELEDARGKVEGIEHDLEKVDVALASLTGKKPKSRSRRSTKKPAPTVDEVRSLIVAVRQEQPFVDGEELQKAVSARVKKEGKSLTGFKKLYAQAEPPHGQSPHAEPPHVDAGEGTFGEQAQAFGGQAFGRPGVFEEETFEKDPRDAGPFSDFYEG